MQLFKWSNSLAFALPEALAKESGNAEGDDVDITAEGRDTIVIGKNGGKDDFVLKLKVSRKS